MDQQASFLYTETDAIMSIMLELVPESDETSPALVNDIGRTVVDSLQREGYDLQPVYTGTRGGPFIVEVVNAITQAATFAWANHPTIEEVTGDTSALVTITTAAILLIRHVLQAYKAQVGNEEEALRPIKISLMIDGTLIEVEAQDVAQADAALVVARKFATAHPQVARKVTTKSKTRVKGRVPSRLRRRRK